jgi:hypothetical protein
MAISYSDALLRAWNRMTKALFQPFDLNIWLKLGFTAWLAGLTDCHGGGGNAGNKGSPDWNDFFSFPNHAWDWLQANPLWFNLIILGIVLVFVIIAVFIWISSRGKFMFLDNVVHSRSRIGEPWDEFRKEGNSLFFWRLIFSFLSIIIFILIFVYCFLTAKELYMGDYPVSVIFWKVTGMVLLFLAHVLIVGYISVFLNDFIIPIMYKFRLRTSWGWYRFLPLMGRHFSKFLVYGLFIFILKVAVVIAVIIASLFTCFIGLILLAIPYIGAVISLPVSYTFRALGPEFLAAFGEEYNIFPLRDSN